MNRSQTIVSIAAALEPGDLIGYSCKTARFTVRWLQSPTITTGIIWDIHAWGIQCVPQDDDRSKLLVAVQWYELCTPF
ncbi:hypothetical protein [Leptolyngbya sp. FACHB-711]|uniref:hypothetical protein n=1 Tax=Leptolyngbya sp. FACHB-711 TaxID=2692813 RepID=UPI0016898C37|nr:hypothetical protein [Leptolyngbya sp. FACHB-711]MBD2024209.1 hypothetical protein [Leptolyngbya sp. FACHB-711]